jgi:hypothetical protein
LRDQRVSGDDCEPSSQALGDKDAIKGIAVVEWEMMDPERVRDRDLQRLDTVLVHLLAYVRIRGRWQWQPTDLVLGRYLPRAGGAQKDGIARLVYGRLCNLRQLSIGRNVPEKCVRIQQAVHL